MQVYTQKRGVCPEADGRTELLSGMVSAIIKRIKETIKIAGNPAIRVFRCTYAVTSVKDMTLLMGINIYLVTTET